MVKLKRSIGQKTLLFLAVNAIMDTGIFFTPAIGAALAGPASVISWIVMGIVSIIVAFCFAEFISMYPKAGGIYEYIKRSFSEFPSFIVGWIAWIVANITIAMVVAGSINYIFPQIDFYMKILIAVSLILLFNCEYIGAIGYYISRYISV